MGWKTINGHRYYYKSEREGGRVTTRYIGAGESGLLISLLDWETRDEGQAEREQRRAELEDYESEAMAGWSGEDPEFIATLNRAKSFQMERLRADVRSLASDALATLRELVSGPDVPPSVRLRASLAVLQAAHALKVEEIGPTSAEGVEAKMERDRFLESLG
jgi:hypothetical protein